MNSSVSVSSRLMSSFNFVSTLLGYILLIISPCNRCLVWWIRLKTLNCSFFSSPNISSSLIISCSSLLWDVGVSSFGLSVFTIAPFSILITTTDSRGTDFRYLSANRFHISWFLIVSSRPNSEFFTAFFFFRPGIH